MTWRVKKELCSCAVVVLLLVLAVQPAFAERGPAGVSFGLHNLSPTGLDATKTTTELDIGPPPSLVEVTGKAASQYRMDEDQICVFCHTPHGGSLTGPLWNRSNPATTWTHYNSASLSSYLRGLSVSRQIEDESLLCMSCHDGSIAVNKVLNLPNDRNGVLIKDEASGADSYIVGLGGGRGALIGGSQTKPDGIGDLSDDHPISFSYTGVLGSDEYKANGRKEGELHQVTVAESAGVRFFDGGTTGNDRVECSSCHDPHVNYNPSYGGDIEYAPFLVMKNKGSAMCLACHNK